MDYVLQLSEENIAICRVDILNTKEWYGLRDVLPKVYEMTAKTARCRLIEWCRELGVDLWTRGMRLRFPRKKEAG